MRVAFAALLSLLCLTSFAAQEPSRPHWVRAGLTTNAPLWGLEGGLKFALHPAGFTSGHGGPRGLIRLGYPTLTNGGYDLINFIAVEPTVAGRKGFSELERSASDERPGKLLLAGEKEVAEVGALSPGILTTNESGVQILRCVVRVERFQNGAHVRLALEQRSDLPDELQFTVEAEPDSATIESCILTATMGNKARTRILWLEEGPVSSLQLYPSYREEHFAPHKIFPLGRLPRNKAGDVIVSIFNDEEDPAKVLPFGRPGGWDYRGAKVVQYWRKPAGQVTEALVCAVNGRFTYWMSKQPIPGGIAFENFELREPFRSGQTFIFGISRAWPK